MTTRIRRESAGFTLVELAIVLTIIAALTVAVLKGQALVKQARALEMISTVKDFRSAIQAFQERFHFLPGDFPIGATAEIPSLSAECQSGGSGDGQIGESSAWITTPAPPHFDGESACATEQLILAGMLQGIAIDPVTNKAQPFLGRSGAAWLIVTTKSKSWDALKNGAAGIAAPLPTSVRHVVEFSNVGCEIALFVAAKLSTGNLFGGTPDARVIGAIGNSPANASDVGCIPDTNNDPVPYLAIAL